MTAAEFKKKWSRYQGKESAAYQEHFIDLCRLLAADPNLYYADAAELHLLLDRLGAAP